MGAGFEHLKEILSSGIIDGVDLFYQNRPCRIGSQFCTCLTNLLFGPFPIHLFLNAFD